MDHDQRQKVHRLLEDFDTAMLVTQGDDETPHARPMALAGVEPNCDVWFFTARHNAMVQEIQNDQQVLIVCQDEGKRFVSLTGRAELVVDRNKAQQLWHESYAAWFRGGVEDPQLLLIHVHADAAELWDEENPNGLRHDFTSSGANRATRPATK